jgi:hypothetical protein
MDRRVLLIALLVVCAVTALVALPGTADANYSVGISENKDSMFDSRLFKRLGFGHARLIVYYDLVLKDRWAQTNYDQWMAKARAAGVDVTVVPTRHSGKNHRARPTPRQYRTILRKLHRRYPWVRSYSTWNEANHSKQPLAYRPRLAARYYNVMRDEFRGRGYKLLAADLLHTPRITSWVRTFKRNIKGNPNSLIWGFHNYGDVNHGRMGSTRHFLRLVPGKVWLSETGGIVRYNRWRYNERRAARATRCAFRIARRFARITRVYIYHWQQESQRVPWDSGLLRANGRPRPALEVVRRELARAR